jgi:DNA repair exonuclease SbcCD nuclease subunit
MHTATFRIGHTSDTHLGYEAYPALSASGNNQRGEDMVRAFINVCEDIEAWDPSLVIHAGDVTEKPKVDIRYMLVAQRYFSRLAGIRPDGSRRQVIIVAGNHEQPHSRKEVCWLELLKSIPGIRVVTDTYRVERYVGGVDSCPVELDGLAIHAIPHDTLKELDSVSVVPDPEASANVLITHGVAMGSELFLRSLGREFPIDGDMLAREWDYVALGHFHKRGPVAVGRRAGVDRVWYSGSSEHVSFRDLRDNNDGKGYLRVEINGPELMVNTVTLKVRPMFRLPVVDGTGMSAQEITEAMRANLAVADITGAVVGQVIEGVTRDMWSLLDISSVRVGAREALHYEITPRFIQPKKVDSLGTNSGLGELAIVLEEQIVTGVDPKIADGVRTLATSLLGSALHAGDASDPQSVPPTDPTPEEIEQDKQEMLEIAAFMETLQSEALEDQDTPLSASEKEAAQ